MLALDTSGPACSVALMESGNLLCEALLHQNTGHARSIMVLMDQALNHAGKTLADIAALACVVGPGSFTGVRIAVSTAKAIGEARHIPCIPVHALDALALNAPDFPGLVCALLDARAGQVYAAAYARGKRVMEDAALPLEEFADRVRPLGERFCFVGDGSFTLRERIEAIFGRNAYFPPEPLRVLRASLAAHWAFAHRDSAVSPEEMHAYYLREPQAVRERSAR